MLGISLSSLQTLATKAPHLCHAKRCTTPAALYWPAGKGAEDPIAPILVCQKHYNAHMAACKKAGQPWANPLIYIPGSENTPAAPHNGATQAAPEVVQADTPAAPSAPVVGETSGQPAALAAQASEYQAVLQQARDFEITDQDDLDFALDMIRECRADRKALEAQLKKATGPLNAGIKEIRGWYKPATTALAEVEQVWRDKVAQAQAKEKAQEAALLEQARAAQDAGDLEGVQAAALAIATTRKELQGAHTATRWDFEVTDLQAVPRKYLLVDAQAVLAEIRATGGGCQIPGIKPIKIEDLRVRS